MAKKDIKLGETHYIGGPCKHGNTAARRMSDRKCTCADCSRELVEKRLRNRQETAERQKRAKEAQLGREIITWEQAKAKGLAVYFTGEPCQNGSVAARRVCNSHCVCLACSHGRVAANAERMREVPQLREAAKERNRRWRAANADHVRAWSRDYEAKRRTEDPQSARERARRFNRQWLQQNPEQNLARWHKRRASKMQATPPWFGELDALAVLEAAHLCRLRAKSTGFPWHVDHAIPLKAREACGLHCAANLQVIPAALNCQKKNRMRFTAANEWLGAAA